MKYGRVALEQLYCLYQVSTRFVNGKWRVRSGEVRFGAGGHALGDSYVDEVGLFPVTSLADLSGVQLPKKAGLDPLKNWKINDPMIPDLD